MTIGHIRHIRHIRRIRFTGFIGVLFALTLAACNSTKQTKQTEQTPSPGPGQADSKPSSERDPAPPEPDLGHPTGDPGVREDGSVVSAVDWFDGSLEQAQAQARDQSKLIFLDIGAYWCPPCHRLDETVFTVATVGDWLREHTLALHIDAEKGEGPEIVERYHVQAYPTLLLLEAGGLEKGRLVDALPPEALIAGLEALAEGGDVLTELTAAAAAAPDDLEAQYTLAHAHVLAAQREQAEAIFDDLLARDPDNESGVAAKVLYDRALFLTFKLDADPRRAIVELEALQARFPDSPKRSQAYRIIGRAYCKLGEDDRAVAALDAMVAEDPDDPNLKSRYGWFSFRQRCRPDAGLEAVLAGIEQDPKLADLHYLEAELRHLNDQPAEALSAIQRAAALEPGSAYFKRQVRRFQSLAEPG